MATRVAILFAAVSGVAAVSAAALAARTAVGVLEGRIVAQIAEGLTEEDGWVKLMPSGTLLTLTGTAPDRGMQIATLARIGAAAGGISIRDITLVSTEVAAANATPAAVPVALEILKSDTAVTLFGTVPTDSTVAEDRGFARLSMTNMLTTADGTVDPLWDPTVAVAMDALAEIPRGRVSVAPGAVTIAAAAASGEERDAWLERFDQIATDRIAIDADISTTRQVVAPYTFSARLTAGPGARLRLQTCTAQTAEAAARLAALSANDTCAVGLGAPSPQWEQAVTVVVDALQELGAGAVDISDADIAITGPQGADPAAFAARIESLRAALPEAFSLSGSLPPPPEGDATPEALEPPRFTAVRTEDGAVRIRGDVNDQQIGDTARTFAEAKFGFETVINETATREDLPSEWAVRIFGGLEGLGALSTGQLEVTEGVLTLTGAAPSLEVRESIEARLRDRLPPETEIIIDVWEAEALELDPLARIPADLCFEQIELILSSATIIFPPGETDIDDTSLPIVDRIAEVLRGCPGARFEIGGHTDSQGRESSNLAISQARADAVLSALLEREIDTVFLYARGYGEAQPIADNDTEEGRARNRRIAFRLIEEDAEGPPLHGGGEEVQAEAVEAEEEGPGIETARRESPTTIVVPAGTDPSSVLPPAALDQEATAEETADVPEGEASDVEAEGQPATPEGTGDTAEEVEDVAVAPPASNEDEEAAEPRRPSAPLNLPQITESSGDAGSEAPGPDADVAATPAPEVEDGDQIRPLPRQGNLPQTGN